MSKRPVRRWCDWRRGDRHQHLSERAPQWCYGACVCAGRVGVWLRVKDGDEISV